MASLTIHLFSAYPRVYRVDYVITLGRTPFYSHVMIDSIEYVVIDFYIA
jgi:hypothetical protein